jgi:2-polyprenyl-6-methoxyphenol hydroxylase-like FAD-dependent oxidoreductase
VVAAVDRALIVGGGIAGMSAAIMLRNAGVEVEIVERDPDWRVYGAGISITGATLRALAVLGVLEDVLKQGAGSDGYTIFSVDGRPISFINTPQLEEGIPGAGGVMRPALHDILSRRTLALGAKVRLGVSVQALAGGAQVQARFTDGSDGRYDLVIGADGIGSAVRRLAFPEAPEPYYTGQSCWRLLTDKPPEVTGRQFYLGGPVKVGLNPVSRDQMYMFMLEATPTPLRFDQPELVERLSQLLEGYGGALQQVRASIGPDAQIVHRPVEAVLAPPPWHRDGIVLIGDAAHATTPQLSSGAGMAVEDGIVLAEELQRASSRGGALEAFMERRFERCRMVVENSLQIGRLEKSGADPAMQAEVVERSLAALSLPY